MDKLQWFKFSPSDWMMGRIQRCDLDTQALFLRLCCIYWNKQCKLSKDDAIFEIDQKHFDILVSKKIIFCNDTNISISFLDEQFLEINEEKQDKSKSGIIGNLKRWHRPIFDSYERKEISLEDAIILSKNNSNAVAEQSHPDSNAIAEQSQIIAEKNREDKEQIRKENTFLLEKETKDNLGEFSNFLVLETEEIKKEKSSAKKEKESYTWHTTIDNLLDEFMVSRKQMKKPMTQLAKDKLIHKIWLMLETYKIKEVEDCISLAIESWRLTIYEPRQTKPKLQYEQPKAREEFTFL